MIEAIFSEEVGKRMIVQCPMCCKHRNMNYRAFLLQGHTFCRKCSPIYFNNYIVEKQFGELTVLSIFSNGKGIVCKCLCSCGKIKDIKATNLRAGETVSCGHVAREKASKRMSNAFGDSNPNWRGNTFNKVLTDFDKRRSGDYKRWRKKVIENCFGECKRCGTDTELNVHHIESFNLNKELALKEENGVVLCKKCHTDYHTWNGGFWVPATRESFEEWIKCH